MQLPSPHTGKTGARTTTDVLKLINLGSNLNEASDLDQTVEEISVSVAASVKGNHHSCVELLNNENNAGTPGCSLTSVNPVQCEATLIHTKDSKPSAVGVMVGGSMLQESQLHDQAAGAKTKCLGGGRLAGFKVPSLAKKSGTAYSSPKLNVTNNQSSTGRVRHEKLDVKDENINHFCTYSL